MVSFDLTGKVAVITGGARGLGPRYAEVLAKQGADIALIDSCSIVTLEAAARKVRDAGRKCIALQCRLTDIEQAEHAIDKIEDEFGKIDILVNNPEIVYAAQDMPDMPPIGWFYQMEQCEKATLLFSRKIEKVMAKNGYGRIVNTFSVSGMVDMDKPHNYYTLRASLNTITKTLACEFGMDRITVNCLVPGAMELGNAAEHIDENNPILLFSPMKRLGKENELDGAIVFLTSEAARYTTGQLLYVDGGINSIII